MCARCLKEGGDADDFTALPKRKKRGKPAILMAYVPTEEDERLALEMDNATQDDKVENAQTDLVSIDTVIDIVSISEDVVGNEIGSSILHSSLPLVHADLYPVSIQEDEIGDDVISSILDNSTRADFVITESNDATQFVKRSILESNIWLSTESYMIALCCVDYNELHDSRMYFDNELLTALKKQFTMIVTHVSPLELSAPDFSVVRVLDTFISTHSETLSVTERPEKNRTRFNLCCVGLDLGLVVSLWKSGEGRVAKVLIVDPPPLSSPLPLLISPNDATHTAGQATIADHNGLSRAVMLRSGVGSAGAAWLSRISGITTKLPLLRVALKVHSACYIVTYMCVVVCRSCALILLVLTVSCCRRHGLC